MEHERPFMQLQQAVKDCKLGTLQKLLTGLDLCPSSSTAAVTHACWLAVVHPAMPTFVYPTLTPVAAHCCNLCATISQAPLAP